MNHVCFVVTGLPGCGKTTVGKKLAEILEAPLIDKDTYLEHLFHVRGVGDSAWRQILSRDADGLFITDSTRECKVVLVSHWRPANLPVQYGTPTDWLSESFADIIEVYCTCPIDIAAKRFKTRVRHAGHVDDKKSIKEITQWLSDYNTHLPLGLGNKLVINTIDDNWLPDLRKELQKVVSCNA